MTILLDEGVPRIIQRRLPLFSIFTVEQMGWRGVKNGKLLGLMEGHFSILVTTDKNLRYQQNMSERQISLVILPTNQIPIVIALLPVIEEAFTNIHPGMYIEIPLPPTL